MPKRNKQRAAPTDFNQLARHLVDVTTNDEKEPTPAELSKVMASLGRRGGKIGGKRRLETMSAEERSAVALKAARTRWKKAKAAKTAKIG